MGLFRILKSERAHLIGHVVLACAVALVGIMSVFADRLVFRPVTLPGFERVVALGGLSFPPTGSAEAFWKQATGLEALAYHQTGILRIRAQGQERQVVGTAVTEDYFRAMEIGPTAGRLFAAEDFSQDTPLAVLGESTARSLFGQAELAVGEHVELSGRRAQVVGVVRLPAGLPIRTDLWMNGRAVPGGDLRFLADQRTGWLARRRADVGVGSLRLELLNLLRRLNAEHGPRSGVNYGSAIAVITIQEVAARPYRASILAALVGAFLLMMMALCNSVTLALAQHSGRMSTIRLQIALGATPSRLVREWAGIAFIRALVAGAAGAALVVAVLAGLRTDPGIALHPMLPFSAGANFSREVFWIAFGATVVVWLALACPVSLVLLRTLRVTSNRATGRWIRPVNARSVLAAAQCAIAYVLTVGAMVLWQSASYVSGTASTLQDRHVLAVKATFLNGQPPFLLDSLHAVAGPAVATTSAVPFVDTPGRVAVEAERAGAMAEVYRIEGPLPDIIGLDLATPPDETSRPAVLVSRTLAEALWRKQGAVGRMIKVAGGPAVRVDGVVEDMPAITGDEGTGQVYVTPEAGWRAIATQVSIVARCSGSCEGLEGSLHSALEAAGGNIVQSTWLGAAVELIGGPVRVRARVAALFGVTGVLIAMGSVLSLGTFVVNSRRRELAVRAALGAGAGRLAGQVLSSTLKPMLGGMLAGFAFSLPAVALARHTTFGLGTATPSSLAIAALLLLAGGVTACWRPVLGAVTSDVSRELLTESGVA